MIGPIIHALEPRGDDVVIPSLGSVLDEARPSLCRQG
jgi:hypothetical protein